MVTKKYDLLMSDVRFGHPDLGWVDRRENEDPDDEDLRFQRFLKKKGLKARVYHCTAFVEEDDGKTI